MAARGAGSLNFIDDIIADDKSKIHSEMYRHILSTVDIQQRLKSVNHPF